MRKISSKKLLLSLIVSAMLSPALAANSLEDYIDQTLDRYQTVSETKIAADKSAELSIEQLLTSSQTARHQTLKSNLNTIEQGAKAQNPDDLFLLGYYYYSEGENDNNPETFAKAKQYFLDAEKLGSKDASYLLGELYYYGEGVEQDYPKAAQYYQKAADQGQAEALFSLASLYMSGRGVEENQNKAVELYEAAANLNHPDSINVLAYTYENGNIGDIAPNREKALEWYQKGCEQGNASSCESQDQLTVRSEGFEDLLVQIKKEMPAVNNATDALPLVADILALNTFERLMLLNDHALTLVEGAEAQDADDTYLLGLLYETQGELNNSEADYQKAKVIFEKAAELGSKDALYNLGELYYYGNGVEQDYQKSLEYYSNPSLSDYPEALFSLAVQYDLGEGVDQSYAKSLELYQQAASLGHAPSTFNVGYMYEHGEYVEQDLREALNWYKKACDMQYQDGCYAYSIVQSYFPFDIEDDNDEALAENANDEINMMADSNADEELVADNFDETLVDNSGDNAETDAEVAETLAVESTELETQDPELVLLETQEAAEELTQNNPLTVDSSSSSISANKEGAKAETPALQSFFNEIMGSVAPEPTLTLDSTSILAADPAQAKAFLIEEMPQILENIKTDTTGENLFLSGYLFLLEAYDTEDVDTLNQAIKLFEIASEAGNNDATFYLGKIYFDTAESDSDMIKARYYFEKLRNSDHAEALFYLASIYDLGLGVPQSYEQSFALYQKAAGLGYAPAAYNVGFMYENGESVDIDLIEASNWYNEACILGDSDGCDKVSELASAIEAENQKIDEVTQKIEGGIKNLFKEIINNIQTDEK
ncbi:hypothetical protein GCM10007162_13930 [Ignatzschineria ureiclastica]|nr:tetratricopeptide repeat protein [Ignatzschineria ureiclastica]GGZ99065.1 hypothetical protein GCM10007162_13930 [Ignatzschineria ureiclastica]